ncbi:MAG: outer membrane protein assembly factor BamD [Candidatus Omnitrophica bacterium]|nr:outer membrane protein assembly factor BamD [Candidatus Omnitrophota bacterium]
MDPRRLLPALVIILACAAAAPAAHAGWIWSPRTGWVGPTGAVKDSPEEQLVFSVAFFDRQDYRRARLEFKKLVNAYRESPEAAEAQYYLGRCAEEEGDYYKAFLEYRKAVQTYPSSKRFEEMLEREYQIGNFFLSGKRRKLLGTAALIPARDKAIEVFEALVEDGPFSEYGSLAQYKLGLAHLGLQDYEQAVEAFEQLVARYPDSPLVDDARFQTALASLKGTFQPGYDQSPTDTAIRQLEAFSRDNPTNELTKDAAGRIEELKEQRAAHEYQVGRFYEDRRKVDAAVVYYQTIVDRFPRTSWAPKAAERIQVLKP